MSLYILQSAAAVILTLGLVIVIHEAGHFIVCRLLGVRVERFAFGFGPELWGMDSGGTRFSICAFPLGGFVKPAGENPEEMTGKPDEYFSQNWKRRVMIVYAGPAMNYLLAFVLFTGVVYVKGMPEPSTEAKIGNMMTGFPADIAGLEVGDVVTQINGKPVGSWDELASVIHANPEKEVKLKYRRAHEEKSLRLKTRKDEGSGRGVIGIMPAPKYVPVGFLGAVNEGAAQCVALTAYTIKTIASKMWRREKPDVAGPVGIVQMVSRAAHSGWEDLIFLMGLISVAIGFFNLLPVPLLDGGHGAMYLWEGLSGRKLTTQAMATANSIGIVFLISLLAFATYNDFSRIWGERAARRKAALEMQAQPAP